MTSDLLACAICVLCFHTSLRRGRRGSWRSPRSRDSLSSRQSGAATDSRTPRPQEVNSGNLAGQLSANATVDGANESATHLGHGEDEVHGWMLRVNAFQLHPLLESVLHCWHPLGLSTRRKDRRNYFNLGSQPS